MSCHIHFFSQSGTLERFNQDHGLCGGYHESMVKERNIKRVSHLLLPSTVLKTTLYFLCSATIHGLANNPRIHEMYSRFGPTRHICFDYVIRKARLNAHQRRYETVLSELSARRLLEMDRGARKLQMDDTSHTIILVRRRGGLSEGLSAVEPITAAVEMAIRDQLKNETLAERLILCDYRSW
jgi:hypothetical protein